jgi:hypothetical protein
MSCKLVTESRNWGPNDSNYDDYGNKTLNTHLWLMYFVFIPTFYVDFVYVRVQTRVSIYVYF